MDRLANKVAVVTGAASGIGAATARKLCGEGASVVIADINDDGGRAVVSELSEAGHNAAFVHCDVGDYEQVQAAVDAAVEHFGGLDIIHNNAASSGGGYIADIDIDDWDRSLRVMLTGVFYGMKAAIPAMLARGGGSIINTSSVEGLGAEIGASPYCTAKAGVINLTKCAAVEYGRAGIRANAILPGCVETPMLEGVRIATGRDQEIAEMHALERTLEPEEIADLVAYLASDESSAITGAAIVVDGGMTSNIGILGRPPYQAGTQG